MPDVFQWTLPVSVKPPFTEKYLQEECESEQQGKDGVCLSCEKAENYIECSLIHTFSHSGELSGYTGKMKCSRLWTKMIAITANPRRASTTLNCTPKVRHKTFGVHYV